MAISFQHGLNFYDRNGYGDWDWSDEELAFAYEMRSPEYVVKTPDNDARDADLL